MTHIDAMKQWLDTMELVSTEFVCNGAHHAKKDRHGLGEPCPIVERYEETITSLRQAIAEVEAEKVEYAYVCVGCDYLSWANNFSCECQVPPLMKFKRVKVIR